MEGIINILKPPGMTSHDVVAFLRRTLREKRIGHCGTLDPQAAGVLPVCLGQAARLADYLAGGEKSYYGEMRLGYETDTQDIWGEITDAAGTAAFEPAAAGARLAEIAASLEGPQLQEVPAYSAVKIAGESLHRLARAGKPRTGLQREVLIRSLRLVRVEKEKISFMVECGKGTYVRMLCRDFGRLLGTGAVMSFLLRLSVGPCRLEDSVTLEAVRQAMESGGRLPEGFVAPKELALGGLTPLSAEPDAVRRLRQGQAQWLSCREMPPSDRKAYVLDADGRLAALGVCRGRQGESGVYFQPEKTFGQ